MNNIATWSVDNKVSAWLLVLVLLGGGFWGFAKMGKLEDPAFTIKMAKILTPYPGATAREVQEELTYHLEDALQRLPQLKRIKMSVSRPGLSDITIEFKDRYGAAEMPNIFDELRRKIADVRRELPPGAGEPLVIDDFGDVYGVYLMLTGVGYSWRDLYDTADALKRELVLVPGVRKVTIDGVQEEVVYVDISRARLGELGISPKQIAAVLGAQNSVVDAGNMPLGDEYLRLSPTGTYASVQAMGNTLISSEEGRLVRLRDVADITRAYRAVPRKLYYVNGEPGLSIGISMAAGRNVVEVGRALAARFEALRGSVPIGMRLDPVYSQPTEVENSVAGFVLSVAQAIAIVIVVLLLFMGLRVGIIIGSVLLLTVAGTLLFMHLGGIELQRVSLGALVIALGMLVDNAIVVAEGIQVRMQAGASARSAAGEAVGKTMIPLLGGTAIGILAFSPIALSTDNTGEFAGSLFWVILISLALSWLTAVSSTPLLFSLLMKTVPAADAGAYEGRLFRGYRVLLGQALQHRRMTLGAVLLMFVAAVMGFGQVKAGFFPASSTPLMFVDLWEPEGTDIRQTRDDARAVSGWLAGQPEVTQAAAVVGGPHQRFTLVYDAKESTPAYAQIVVRTETLAQQAPLRRRLEKMLAEHKPWLDPLVKPLRMGPGRDAKIEARFSGPDPVELRRLADRAKQLMRDDPDARDVRDDWRSPVKVLRPQFSEQLARRLGISREDLGDALKYGHDGAAAGTFRDGNRVLPVFIRATGGDRSDIGGLRDLQVWSPALGRSVPISQVVSGFETRWENGVIRGRNRQQTIIASCNPVGELTAPLFERLRPRIEALELPQGYSLSWGGEFEDARNAQGGLLSVFPAGILFMVLTTVFLFGKVRQPLIIWLTVPLAIVGITAGLLAADGAFDFMSLLGALSLIGLLIKNAIVLIEEMDQQLAAGKGLEEGILDAGVSRLRPVILAAATTILGLIPLLGDVFFVNMAVTIMAGLGFASLLTLFVVPTLYLLFFRQRAAT
ncbi:efflux RND transporter permease subunit [Pseudohaliea rubra]|uniref:Acriflavin resistance protein n=1 Tax=Pseudohaliea rubra DSM 19751 TaxID=1265313 RepID=A0A095VQA8_9GAMM|nr:efflux RND transporter permease subunit [Pseudohaliea rubra]KGE03550.1 Acriflavin resistance protein [Pseudohaliea rubra DSM 19751]